MHLNEAKGFMEKGDEAFKKAFANNIGQEIQNRTDLTSEEKAEIALAASAHAGFSVLGNGAEIQSSASSKRGIGNVETFSEAQKAAYNEIMERASLKTLSTTKGMDSSWSNTLSGGDSTAYSKMVGYTQSYTQTEQGIQSVSTNNIDNTLNVVARDLAAGDNKDLAILIQLNKMNTLQKQIIMYPIWLRMILHNLHNIIVNMALKALLVQITLLCHTLQV